ncbi:MAG: nucleotidyltransferase family protein [Oscillospiraceae bacterium]
MSDGRAGIQCGAARRAGQRAELPRHARSRREKFAFTGRTPENTNNILGLEYCKAALGRRIRPAALHRAGDYHAPTPDAEAPSASSLRAVLEGNGDVSPFVPEAAARRYVDAERHFPQYGERAMLARLRSMTPEDWARTAHGSEGLWSLAMRAAQCCGTLQELESMVKSRRYPMTRVRRLLLCAALGLTEDGLNLEIPYVRALAMDGAGRRVLREMRDLETLPSSTPGKRRKTKTISSWSFVRRASTVCSARALCVRRHRGSGMSASM